MKKNTQKRKNMTKKRPSGIAGVSSLFPEKPSFLLPLICKSKPNFKSLELIASTCKRETNNYFCPQTNKKSKPNPNPIQTQSKPNPKPIQTQFKANLPLGHYSLDRDAMDDIIS
ncbi:MAG TPA: hypothetical protein ENH94_00750 [Phycisphaerales bacterium]|nr:hypothetical protein [Phycisphaerales bacterium]